MDFSSSIQNCISFYVLEDLNENPSFVTLTADLLTQSKTNEKEV